MSESNCENCPMRKKAEANPKTLLARLWKWHTNWCPGWKAYQKSLTQGKTWTPAPPTACSPSGTFSLPLLRPRLGLRR